MDHRKRACILRLWEYYQQVRWGLSPLRKSRGRLGACASMPVCVCHMWMSHGTYECVMSHIWMSHVTKISWSARCLRFECLFVYVICGWVMEHMNVSCHTYEWVMSNNINKSCRICGWVMTHVWMSHDTSEWIMSHIRMSHVLHVNESRHTYEWVMSHMWMSHATHMNESCHTCERVMSHIRMSHACHTCE